MRAYHVSAVYHSLYNDFTLFLSFILIIPLVIFPNFMYVTRMLLCRLENLIILIFKVSYLHLSSYYIVGQQVDVQIHKLRKIIIFLCICSSRRYSRGIQLRGRQDELVLKFPLLYFFLIQTRRNMYSKKRIQL